MRHQPDLSNEQLDLVDRWVVLWNEPDPEARRKLLRDVWAPNGAQVLVDPPQDVRDAAERLQFPPPSLEVRGYEALAARVARAYEMFVAPGEHVFRRGGDVLRLRSNVLGVAWEMVTTTGGDVVGGGFDVLRLDADGRVRTDYQFIGA